MLNKIHTTSNLINPAPKQPRLPHIIPIPSMSINTNMSILLLKPVTRLGVITPVTENPHALKILLVVGSTFSELVDGSESGVHVVAESAVGVFGEGRVVVGHDFEIVFFF